MSTDPETLKPFFQSTKELIDHVEEMLSTGRVAQAHEAVRTYRERWKSALWNGKSLPPDKR